VLGHLVVSIIVILTIANIVNICMITIGNQAERKEKNMKTERKIVSEQWFVWGEVNRARSQVCARSFTSIVKAQDSMARLGKVNPAIRYFLSRPAKKGEFNESPSF
jgi:hypothetical protein